MPLPPAAPRQLAHMRDIKLRGYFREDGQIEVEARLTDVKPGNIWTISDHPVAGGEPLHDMWIRLTLTMEELEITACAAVTDAAPMLDLCAQAPLGMERLVGLRIGKGFIKEAMARLAGDAGCTHLRELLQPLATTAIQTRYGVAMGHLQSLDEKQEAVRRLIGSCHTYGETSPLVTALLAGMEQPVEGK